MGDISTRPDLSWGSHQVPNMSCSLKVPGGQGIIIIIIIIIIIMNIVSL